MTKPHALPSRTVRWAVVAGASEGLGAAFAESLAARGLRLVFLARRAQLLESLAAQLSRLARRRGPAGRLRPRRSVLRRARSRARPADLEVGVAVYNAAYSFVAPLFERPLADALRVVDVNVRAPLVFLHALVPAMIARGRGAVVLMSSLAGFQGSPKLAAYAASKAFSTILGESSGPSSRRRGWTWS